MTTCRCGLPAVVQWQRRPTEAETASILAVEEARRAAAAEAGRPAPDAPLPSANTTVVAVYACVDHALNADAAALIHEATCSGPGVSGICDCTPEPAPSPESPGSEEPGPRLPPGW